MLKEAFRLVQEPLKAFLPSLSDESKEALRLECNRLQATLEKRNLVSLKATLAGVTLDETETYEALRGFAKPGELNDITEDVDRLFSVSLSAQYYRADKHAIPPCLSFKANPFPEHSEILRELTARWFGARAGSAARKNQVCFWPSWFRHSHDRGLTIYDWPVRLPCPCCGSARAGVFKGLAPNRVCDETEWLTAQIEAFQRRHDTQMEPCQQCGHVETFGCACKVCAPDYARLLDHFADHAKVLPSLYRTVAGVGRQDDAQFARVFALKALEDMLEECNIGITDARMRHDYDTHKGNLPLTVRALLAKACWEIDDVKKAVADYCMANPSAQPLLASSHVASAGYFYKTQVISLRQPFVLAPNSVYFGSKNPLVFPKNLANHLAHALPGPLQWLALLPTLTREQQISELLPMLARAENQRFYYACLLVVQAFHNFGIGVFVSEDIVINPYYLNADEAVSSDDGTLAVTGS